MCNSFACFSTPSPSFSLAALQMRILNKQHNTVHPESVSQAQTIVRISFAGSGVQISLSSSRRQPSTEGRLQQSLHHVSQKAQLCQPTCRQSQAHDRPNRCMLHSRRRAQFTRTQRRPCSRRSLQRFARCEVCVDMLQQNRPSSHKAQVLNPNPQVQSHQRRFGCRRCCG